jgi:hypothetical protein
VSTQTCASGVCTCPSGQSLCSNSCVNLTSNPANCGSCGYSCFAEQVCSGGTCLDGLPTPGGRYTNGTYTG